MFRIRDFSRLTRLSAKTLRHYDRLGLLRPASVDPKNRYRSYSASQLMRLQRIVAMRDLGFSLEEIGALLDERLGVAGTRRRLRDKRAEIERRIASDTRRLSALEARLRESEGGGQRFPDVVVRELPSILVATRRARVSTLDDGARELFETVEVDVARAGVRAAGPPLLLYHDRDYREWDADIEAAVPVTSPGVSGRSVASSRPSSTRRVSTVRLLPGLPHAACLVYAGSYDRLNEILGRVRDWLATQKLRVSGPWREAYLQFNADGVSELGLPPAYLADAAEHCVTEIQIPLAPPPASHRMARNSA